MFKRPEKRPNYVGAAQDYDTGQIMVFTREGGVRNLERFDPPLYFYTPDPNGEYVSMYRDRCRKIVAETVDEFELLKKIPGRKFESDVPPLDKVLIDEFYGLETPEIYFTFFDIEVDYDSKIGFSRPNDPYAPINAVTLYTSWNKKYITIAVPPKNWDGISPTNEMAKQFDVHVKTEFKIVGSETELLTLFLQYIEPSDMISGWNSDFFDLPYMIKRTEMVLGKKMLAKWGFPGCRYPRAGETERFGSKELTYKIFGRSHIDYLQAFKKFTFGGRTSYALGSIMEEEIGYSKLEYEGTLEELYNKDFIKFCFYNLRDVEGLVMLDAKFKFVSLINQMAHENCVLYDSIMGTVKYVETGVTAFAHYEMGLVVQDKKISTDGEKVEGAIVLNPKIGLHDWVGSVDINSLYPNVIRSLNMSPETFIGQFTQNEADWRGIAARDDKNHILVCDNGEEFTGTGAEWAELLTANKWAVSGYGSVFDQGNGPGILPTILGSWYSNRKKLQAEKKKYAKLAKEEKDPEKKKEYEQLEELYDLLQLTKKISLNSLYGALLNAVFRFGRKELGASTTGSGRQITTHMMASIAQFFTGSYIEPLKSTEVDKDGKIQNIYVMSNESPVVYGDTDSAYFSVPATNREEAIEMADLAAEYANNSFPDFMRDKFLCQPDFDNLIKCGREIVAIRGLFQAKKKYICRVIDMEGAPVDKLKSMGSEIKKSDTPKTIQKFLTNVLDLILDGKDYAALEDFVINQRDELIKNASDTEIISMGVNKQVNKLDAFYEEWKKLEKTGKKKVNLPGHVRASINFNEMSHQFEGTGGAQIKSGDKVIIFYVKQNQYGFSSIAFPAETTKFPQWFLENFKVDVKLTEEKMIDLKLEGIFSAIGWEVPDRQTKLTNSLLVF